MLKRGMYQDIIDDQVDYVHIQGIDNVLTKSGDPFFTGYLISQCVDLCFKIVKKAYPNENVGLHVKKGDHFTVYGNVMRVCQHE